MKHITHRTWLTRIGVAILLVTAAITASVTSASSPQNVRALQLRPSHKKAVQCFTLARAAGMDTDVLTLYIQRIGEASGTAGGVYTLGYTEGTLDAWGAANSSRLGGYKKARLHAAKHLYKMTGCTINESI